MPMIIPFVVAAAAAAADIAAVGGIAAAFASATAISGVLAAASLGFAAGSIIGNLLFPTHTTSSSVGPRVGDLSFQTSTYGNAIPILFGTDRMSGNVIWATPIKEVSTTTTQSSGGKGPHGGSSASQTLFTYFGNFAVGLCGGVKAGILRIWANNNLIYDDRTGTDVIKKTGVEFTFYAGTETQVPDPLMEADKGAGNVPAYRGLCYVVFKDLPLADYGNTVPSLSFEVADQLAFGTRVIDLVEGPLLHQDNNNFWSVTIDKNKDVGYASLVRIDNPGVGSLIGIAVFNLENMTVFREALGADILINEYSIFGPTLATDGNLYFAVIKGFAIVNIWIVKVDANLLKEVDSVLVQLHTDIFVEPGLVIGTRVFSSDGSFFDCLLYVRDSGARLSIGIISTSPLSVAYLDDSIMERYPSSVFGAGVIVGDVTTTYSDFYLATDVSDTSNVVSKIRRIRVYGDGGIDVAIVRSFVPTDFSATATEISRLNFSGLDFSAGLLIMKCSVTPLSSGDYVFAVDTSSFAIVWSYPGLAITSPLYTRVHDDIITQVAPWIVLTSTATGTGTVTNADSLPESYTVYWDSTSRSYLRFGYLGVARVFIGRATSVITTTLGSICADISERVGNTSYDTSTINSIVVTGFTISRVDTAANALNAVMAGFQVDVAETDYAVHFRKRGSDTVVTIEEDTLVLVESSEAPESYKETWQQSVELPTYLNITYEDVALDYQPNTQHDQRVRIPSNPTVFSGQTSDVQVPIVMDATTARQIAETLLYTTWLNRHTFQLRVSPRYLWLDPSDPIQLVLNSGYTVRVRLGKTDLGADFTSETLLISESDGQYTSSLSVTVTNPFPLNLPASGPSLLILLDVPLLRDGDEVIASSLRGYWGASTYSTGRYTGGTLYESSDAATWNQLDAVTAATPFGYVETPPPDPVLMWTIDHAASLTVSMSNGATHLVSVSDLAICNGANAAALIKTNGEVEVFQYRDVTALGGDRYTLTGLLRGRRGTDAMALGHVAGELFVLIGTGSVHGLAGPIASRDTSLWWDAVTIGALHDPANRTAFTFHARDKFPYAPVNVTATLSGGDIDLAWVRRTRVDGGLRDGTGVVPLHEVTELYEVDILAGPGGMLKRTLVSLTSPAAVYASSDVITDFGAPPATLTLRVYQLSGVVGRGFSREDTVTVA